MLLFKVTLFQLWLPCHHKKYWCWRIWFPAGAVELRNNLSSRFNLELPSTVIFDYPNVKALAGFIASRQSPEGLEGSEISEEDDYSDEGDEEGAVDVESIK